MARLFDQVAILSKTLAARRSARCWGRSASRSTSRDRYLLLARNPNYWKTEGGRRLPYLDGVRLDILQNRELELLRFRQGQIHFISALDPDLFEQLAAQDRAARARLRPVARRRDDVVQHEPRRAHPGTTARRGSGRGISAARSRTPSGATIFAASFTAGMRRRESGPFSPANLFWFNQALKPHAFDLAEAKRLLAADGFRLQAGGAAATATVIRWSSR